MRRRRAARAAHCERGGALRIWPAICPAPGRAPRRRAWAARWLGVFVLDLAMAATWYGSPPVQPGSGTAGLGLGFGLALPAALDADDGGTATPPLGDAAFVAV